MVAAEQRTFRTDLERWHMLHRRRQALAPRIDQAQELRLRLHVRLTPDGIMSTLTQQYSNMDMPRAEGGVSDKTGNLVATTLERRDRTDDRLTQWRQEYIDVCDELAHIESWVDVLEGDYAKVVTAFYRDRVHRVEICRAMAIDESTMYRMIDKAVEQVDRELRMFGR